MKKAEKIIVEKFYPMWNKLSLGKKVFILAGIALLLFILGVEVS
jgi:hypothetical protein